MLSWSCTQENLSTAYLKFYEIDGKLIGKFTDRFYEWLENES